MVNQSIGLIYLIIINICAIAVLLLIAEMMVRCKNKIAKRKINSKET